MLLELQIDGISQSITATTTAGSGYDWITAWTGLDASSYHFYRVSIISNPGNLAFVNLMTSGGSGVDETYTPNLRPSVLWIGNSIVNGLGATDGADTRTGPEAHGVGEALNYAVASVGVNGQPMPTDAGAAFGASGIVPSDVIITWYGYGDLGVTSPSDFKTKLTTHLAAIRSSNPNATIIQRAILPTTANGGDIATLSTAAEQAVAAMGTQKFFTRIIIAASMARMSLSFRTEHIPNTLGILFLETMKFPTLPRLVIALLSPIRRAW